MGSTKMCRSLLFTSVYDHNVFNQPEDNIHAFVALQTLARLEADPRATGLQEPSQVTCSRTSGGGLHELPNQSLIRARMLASSLTLTNI